MDFGLHLLGFHLKMRSKMEKNPSILFLRETESGNFGAERKFEKMERSKSRGKMSTNMRNRKMLV